MIKINKDNHSNSFHSFSYYVDCSISIIQGCTFTFMFPADAAEEEEEEEMLNFSM